MKIRTFVSACVAGAILVGFAGCKKEDVDQTKSDIKSGTDKTVDAVKNAASDAKDGAEKVATEVKDGAVQAAGEVKTGAENAVTAVKEKAAEMSTPAPAPAPAAADGIIAKAQALVADSKYQDALTELGSLKGMTLSDAQQKLVDDLKVQIQKGITASGSSAVGNLLK